MAKSARQRAHLQGTSARNRVLHLPRRIAPEAAPDLSWRARSRLGMLDWHERHGHSVSRTTRHPHQAVGYLTPSEYLASLPPDA